MTTKQLEKKYDKELRREFKKTYLKLMQDVLWHIQEGSEEAAQAYGQLETIWKKYKYLSL